MTNETKTTNSRTLVHGECLTGRVTKPYIKDDRLLGAVLSFDGRCETALLHLRQMTGDEPGKRLSALSIGDSLLVRIMVQKHGTRRKDVWATEKGIENQLLVESFQRDPNGFKNICGRVHSLTDFGLFIELLEGPAKGHRALLRSTDLAPGERLQLGAFVAQKVGHAVMCDLADARLDGSDKLLLRVNSARAAAAA